MPLALIGALPWVLGLAAAHYTVKLLDSTADVADSTADLADSLTKLAVVGSVAYVGYVASKRVLK